MGRLKSCSYCGGIHDIKFKCPRKPDKKYYSKGNSNADKFRWSKPWQKKRRDINIRDNYICQICCSNIYEHDEVKYNHKDIEVHHIVSIADDWDKRLDDENLICLCSHHHKQAELKKIPKDILISIVKEKYR